MLWGMLKHPRAGPGPPPEKRCPPPPPPLSPPPPHTHPLHLFPATAPSLPQWNTLPRPCGLFADRRQGDVFFIGELGTALPVNAQVPDVGNRVTILSGKGELVGRVGDRFGGEAPGQFVAPHGVATDSRGDLYVAEVAWTRKGSKEQPPREIRSLQKFERV